MLRIAARAVCLRRLMPYGSPTPWAVIWCAPDLADLPVEAILAAPRPLFTFVPSARPFDAAAFGKRLDETLGAGGTAVIHQDTLEGWLRAGPSAREAT